MRGCWRRRDCGTGIPKDWGKRRCSMARSNEGADSAQPALSLGGYVLVHIFHEAAHVLMHETRRVFVEIEGNPRRDPQESAVQPM